jgi:uncharacterized membrane protein YgaE (UPF0421/DUF939 family)
MNVFNPVFLYMIQIVAGLVIGYSLYYYFPGRQFVWTIISILLIITPYSNDSKQLALNRIKANIIGLSIGVIIFFIHKPNLLSLCIGSILIIIICARLNLITTARSALVAFIIVTIHSGIANSNWLIALERMGCVLAGCAIAITLMAVQLLRQQS